MQVLAIQERKNVSRQQNEQIRTAGDIPAVLYGTKQESTSISVSQKEFEKVWKEAGESSVISLQGVGEDKEVLIQDVDIDPVAGTPRHADFYVLEKGKKVEVRTPLEFSGVAPAVKDLGGTLIKVLHDIAIEALPKDLPHEIAVDISSLKTFDDQIHAKDVVLPAGVELVENPDEVIALVQETEEETFEEVEAFDATSVEVEKKGKEETEGEGSAEGEASTEEK